MAEYIDREKAKRLLHIEYAYAAEQLLDEIPAADVAPVVHGRWIYDEKAQRPYCSICKEYFYGATNSSMNYCSNCGAKMDGDDGHAYL